MLSLTMVVMVISLLYALDLLIIPVFFTYSANLPLQNGFLIYGFILSKLYKTIFKTWFYLVKIFTCVLSKFDFFVSVSSHQILS